ncbi:MAG: hypothetical protein JWR65_1869 [Massilia sp.]|jgi:uncharacterized protein YggE|nr:hypothetical protein [Massilia sp.]
MLKNTVAVTALLFFSFVASASQLPDYPFIHAGGSGLVRVPPDVGEIVFDISAYHAEPETARQVVETRIADVRALVAAQALPEADVQIRDVRKDFRKADPAQPGVVSYDIKCSVHIKVSDISKWQALVSPLINMPNLDGFTTSFDVTKREEVEAELTLDAIKAARRKAEVIAAGFGRKLGPVGGVSTGELRNLTRAMGMAAAEPGRSARPAARSEYDRDALLMVTLITMSQSVDVIFRIK